ITNDDRIRKVRMFQETISQNKVQQMGGARGRAYAIDGEICPTYLIRFETDTNAPQWLLKGSGALAWWLWCDGRDGGDGCGELWWCGWGGGENEAVVVRMAAGVVVLAVGEEGGRRRLWWGYGDGGSA
nr:hypothetical protein [Tanacetum cinerariifolium]